VGYCNLVCSCFSVEYSCPSVIVVAGASWWVDNGGFALVCDWALRKQLALLQVVLCCLLTRSRGPLLGRIAVSYRDF
jgi:hypothetical protein